VYTEKKINLTPTQRLMKAYEAAYCYFRDHLITPVLGETLPDPILTFSRSRRKTSAFFLPDTWRSGLEDKERRCELALVPEHTGEEPRILMSILVHEMIHYVDHLAGTAPKSHGYHGQKWAKRMEKLGLPPVQSSKTSKIAVTHQIQTDGPYAKSYDKMPKSILLPFVAGLEDIAHENDDEQADQETQKSSKSGKRFKYSCPQCETTMRGPAERKLICGDCNIAYEGEA